MEGRDFSFNGNCSRDYSRSYRRSYDSVQQMCGLRAPLGRRMHGTPVDPYADRGHSHAETP